MSFKHRVTLVLLAALAGGIVAAAVLVMQPASMPPDLASLPTLAVLPATDEPPALPPDDTAAQPAAALSPAATPPPTDIADTQQTTASLVPDSASSASAPEQPRVIVREVVAVPIPAEPVPQVVLVTLPDTAAQQAAIAQYTAAGAQVSVIDGLNTLVVSLPDDVDPASIAVAGVAEPDYYVAALASDPLLPDQWAIPALGVQAWWDALSPDAPAITVAVIDSGINPHPDLAGRVTVERDFVESDAVAQDDFGHGTGVAALIAANHDAIGMAGLAPNASLMDLRVLDARGLGRYSDVAAAIVYAADNGAHIINLSLGGVNPSQTLQNALDYALARGVTVVAAAGNTGGQVLFPASYAPVIAVGSHDASGSISSFSARGSLVDTFAPGGSVLTATHDGAYAFSSGTSFAAPVVSGALALARAQGLTIAFDGGMLALNAAAIAQATPGGTPGAQTTATTETPGGYTQLEGTLLVWHGDPEPGSDELYRQIVALALESGDVVQLNAAPGRLQPFQNQRVRVSGRLAEAAPLAASAVEASAALDVEAVISLDDAGAQSFTGSKPYVNILCRFDGGTDPSGYTPTLIADRFVNTYPGVDHYWRQVSYNNINIAGTTTVATIQTLPKQRGDYFNGSNANLSLLATDCIAAHNAAVNFASFFGINMFFDENLDCCAWGGSTYVGVDGVNGYKPATWLPIWAHDPHTIIHEMGHAFGLPHSSGPANNPPSGLSIYVSNWDVMSGYGTGAVTGTYGRLATNTIAFHLDKLGWIPTSRVVTVPRNTANSSIALDRTINPDTGTNALIIKVPINSDRFYTVEVRDISQGYDQNIPAKAVIIHDVLLSRQGNTGPALVVDSDTTNTNVNDAGAQWTVGETFNDAVNNIQISVLSASGTGYIIGVNNNSPNPPSAPTGLGLAAANQLTASPLRTNTHTTATLTWTDTSINETGFRVQRFNGTSWVLAANAGANATSATITGLTCNTANDFRVVAFNSGGESSPSATLTVNTLFCPPANDSASGAKVITGLPYNDTATDVHGATIPASAPLDPPANACGSFRNSVWYRFSTTTTRQISVTTAGSSYGVHLAVYSGASPTTFVGCSTASPASLLFNATAGVTYWIMAGHAGTAPLTAAATLVVEATAPPLPVPTLNLPADAATLTTATPALSWLAIAGATGYDVQIDTTNTFVNAATFRVAGTSFIVPYALPDPTYVWRVRLVIGTETSDYSAARQFNVNPAVKPAPYRNLFTTSTPTLAWGQVSYATQYEVQISRNNTFTALVATLTTPDGSTLSVVTPALTDGLYFWRVRAKQANGTFGPYSAAEPLFIHVES